MGNYENQLKAITSGATWNIQQLDSFKAEMSDLQDLMTTIAASPGWTGASADEAREKFAALRREFAEIETKLTAARHAIEAANRALTKADNAHATLPSVWIPDWLYEKAAQATAGTMIPVPFVGEFRAEVVIQRVKDFFGSQREAAAHRALDTLTGELVEPKQQLKAARLDPPGVAGSTSEAWPEDVTPPSGGVSWGGDDNGNGAWSTGGSGGGTFTGSNPGHPSSPPWPPIVLSPVEEPGPWGTIGVDGDVSAGTTGGGGLSGGLLGAGAGVGGLAVASKLAKGGLGAGGLGAGGAAGGGVGVAGGMGGGAGAAGGRSNAAMMGGGAPGGGGGSEKEKRNGLGLIAPKLEDDDETGPRSAAAGAGGRE
jgi:uncharacterized protein YukE